MQQQLQLLRLVHINKTVLLIVRKPVCVLLFPVGVVVAIILNQSLFTEVQVTCHCPPVHCGKESGAVGR